MLHVSLFLSNSNYEVGKNLPHWLRYVIFSSGGNGVSTFFAISGFLITFISIRRFGSLRHIVAKTFYQIRFARIAPPLILLLLTLSILHLANIADFRIKSSVTTLPRALFAALTFHLNWLEAVHGWLPATWTVLWSLSVEEMFYLFFPVLCIALLNRRSGLPAFITLLCCLILFGPFARTPWYTKNDIWAYQSYLGNMDNVALGCLFALLTDRLGRSERFLRSRWPLCLQVLGAVAMLFVVFWAWPRVLFGWHIKHALGHTGTDVTLLGFGTCLVMLGSVLRQSTGSSLSFPVRWLGRYSYEVYLTHEFVVMGVLSIFIKLHRGPIALWISAVIILSGALGFVLSRTISEPANRALRGAPLPVNL